METSTDFLYDNANKKFSVGFSSEGNPNICLYLDKEGGLYVVGDFNNSANGVKLTVDDSDNQITLSNAQKTLLDVRFPTDIVYIGNVTASSAIQVGGSSQIIIGDLFASGNSTKEIVDDANQTITLNANNGVVVATVQEFADNAAAVSAGLAVGTLYRTNDVLKIVH